MRRIRRADRANCAHTSCWLIASPGCGWAARHPAAAPRRVDAVPGDSRSYEAGARFDTSPHRIRSQSHCVAADEEHYQGARATLARQPSECDRSIARSGSEYRERDR